MKLGEINYDRNNEYRFYFYHICGNEIDKIMEMMRWEELTDKRRDLVHKLLGPIYINFLRDNQDRTIHVKYHSLPSEFSEYAKLVRRGMKVKRIKTMLQK